MISLYDSNETVFTSNGLVVLSDAISCMITEELNGAYELDMEYPLDDRGKWKYLLENNIIKADGQLFRIYYKFKALDSMKVNARHIYYDLLDNLLEDVRPTDISGYGAIDWILTRTQYAHPFTSMGDVGGISTRYFVRKNPVEAIMGTDGIIATWGGELVRDNFEIKLLGARGLDRGVLVSYGKNIQGIEEALDTSGICTRLMPIGKDGLLLTEKYIDSPYINNYPNPKIKVVEFSDAETEATLRTAGQQYMINSKIDIPQFNYKIGFLELSKTEEYKNYAVLERVYEGDTVTIRHSRLAIDLKAKVIKITKNILTGRIEKVELGSFKANLATGINNAIQEVKKEIVRNNSFLQLAIDNSTALLTTALGGFVVKRDGELLIMDTEDPMTALKIWRWNVNGLGYSSTGINGPYGLAMTMDGHIVANFVDTGVLNANIIKAGILKSFNNLSWIDMDTGKFDLAGKVTFDGITFSIEAEAIRMAVGELGTKNLIKNSDFSFPIDVVGKVNCMSFALSQANSPYSPPNSLSIETGGGDTYAYINSYIPVVAGKSYVYSFYYKGASVDSATFYLLGQNGGNYSFPITGLIADQVWRRVSTTWVCPAGVTAVTGLRFGLVNAVGKYGWIMVDNIQLEEGSIVTPWEKSGYDIKSGCFEVTDEHARFTSNDGSYTEFVPASTGLRWHKAGVAKDYHYLSLVGEGTLLNPLSSVTITLPIEYRGKDFSILLVNFSTSACYVSSKDSAAGTFVVYNPQSGTYDYGSYDYLVIA